MALLHVSTRTADAIPHAAGTVVSVKQLVAAAGRYVDARSRLLALEAKLAVKDMKTGVLMLGIAGLLAGIALLVLAAALILWLTVVLPQGNGALACAIVAVVFLISAGVLVWRGRGAFQGKNWLPVTKSELKSDKQWLKEL